MVRIDYLGHYPNSALVATLSCTYRGNLQRWKSNTYGITMADWLWFFMWAFCSDNGHRRWFTKFLSFNKMNED